MLNEFYNFFLFVKVSFTVFKYKLQQGLYFISFALYR